MALLSFCDKRVSVCYGCGNSFRYNGNNPQQPFDLVLVTKFRREYFKDGEKHHSSPSNVYFHVQVDNSFCSPFECVRRKLVTFKVDHVQIHVNAINHLSDSHEVLLRRIKVPFSTNFQTKWNFAVIIQFKIYFVCYSADSVCLMWCFGGAYPPPMENAFTYTAFLINWVESITNYQHNKLSVKVRDICSAWFLKKLG